MSTLVKRSPDTMAGPALAVDPVALAQFIVPLQNSDDSIIPLILFFGVGLFLIYDGFRTWQQMRLMQDTPTEKVRSAAVGRTELTGTGRPMGAPIDRPFTEGDCLVATYKIEEWDDDDDGGNWDTVESGALVAPFELDDGTGSIRVEPEEDATYEIAGYRTRIRVGANETEPENIQQFLREQTNQDVPTAGGLTGFIFGEKRRYTEQVIPPGETLYLLGGATPRDGASGTDSELLVLGRDEASDEFIISNQTQQELVSSYRWHAPAEIVGGLLLSTLMLYLLLGELGMA